MPEYRAYKLGRNYSIKQAIDWNGEDNDKAVAWAEQFTDGSDVEVWQGTRLVRRLPAKSRAG